MATNPSSPGGSTPPSDNGQSNPAPKPRATIVMKNPNSKQTSNSSMPAATSGTPGNSQRLAAARPTGAPNQSARRAPVQVQADREALGLSAARPSEMVEGLEEVAKRAEAAAVREEAKRKSGGKLNLNVALHVDDTGRKWTRWVQLGIGVAVFVAAVVGAVLFLRANTEKLDPRRALAETRALLGDLEITAKTMDGIEAGETVSAASAKAAILRSLQAQLEKKKEQLLADRKNGRQADKGLVQRRDEIEKLMRFKDGWGNPFEFTVTGDELQIRCTSKGAEELTEPPKITLRSNSEKKSEK